MPKIIKPLFVVLLLLNCFMIGYEVVDTGSYVLASFYPLNLIALFVVLKSMKDE